MVKEKFSQNFYNPITYAGALLAVLVLVCEVFLFAIDFLSPTSSNYLGIFTYLVLPPFLILGLILIPYGALRHRKRVLLGLDKSQPKHFFFDPSIPRHRNTFFVFIVGTAIVLLMTAVGSYKAFHYTESVKFCGTTCHQIMIPEYTTYLKSAHARVKCVDCHIGEGAGSYLNAKLAGARQVLKTVQNNYAKPIPPPLHELRPAKDICEQCHWPGKTYNSKNIKKIYYPDDPSQDPAWNLRLQMNIGSPAGSSGAGIHAHMYLDHEIYYAAEDEERQKITWVKSVSKDGREEVFTTDKSPYKDKVPPPNKMRKMDCMDCHNRPAHRMDSPENAVNEALMSNKISPQVAMIKLKSVDILSKKYNSQTEAEDKIRATLLEYYKSKEDEYYIKNRIKIDAAIEQVVKIYKENFFPEMKARWDVYPENIGHRISLGCFRCHDEEHKSSTGKVITRNCNTCHIITEQGPSNAVVKNVDGVEFIHPYEDDGSWKTMNCSDCHTGGS